MIPDRFRFRVYRLYSKEEINASTRPERFISNWGMDNDIDSFEFFERDGKLKIQLQYNNGDMWAGGYLSEAILLQSTGLRDKNNVLIYEGDVVSINPVDGIEMPLTVVRWIDGQARFSHKDAAGVENIGVTNLIDKVVGNIYENLEFSKLIREYIKGI